MTADNGGTSEGNLVNVHMRGDGSTGNLSETRDDVDDSWWEASLLHQICGNESRERGLLSSLENHRVTGGNSGTNLPCPHEQWEVPGDDLTANTNLQPLAGNSKPIDPILTGSCLVYAKVSELVSITFPSILSAQPP